MFRLLLPSTVLLCWVSAGDAKGAHDLGQAAGVEINKVLLDSTKVIRKHLPQQLRASNEKVALEDITQSQRQLIAAQGLFNEATSEGQNDDERALEKDLAIAVSSSEPTLGKPTLTLVNAQELVCLPDLNACPKGWSAQGSQCVAASGYAGPCSRSVEFFTLGTPEKLALIRYCQVELPCQGECAPNFAAVCPSLWSEVAPGVCEAPANYVGDCDHRVETSSMSEQEKNSFAVRCGARWPCGAPEAAGCERDHTAECPQGWRHRNSPRGTECVAPSGFTGCSRVQNFNHMTPIEKQTLARKCGLSWPCVGSSSA